MLNTMQRSPEFSIASSGIKEWRLDKQLHREDGPAVEWPDGSKEWYWNGQRHREDGPAIEWGDGSKMWYLNDVRVIEAQLRNKLV